MNTRLERITARGGYAVHFEDGRESATFETYRAAYLAAFRVTRSIYVIRYRDRQAARPPGVHWDPDVEFRSSGVT